MVHGGNFSDKSPNKYSLQEPKEKSTRQKVKHKGQEKMSSKVLEISKETHHPLRYKQKKPAEKQFEKENHMSLLTLQQLIRSKQT